MHGEKINLQQPVLSAIFGNKTINIMKCAYVGEKIKLSTLFSCSLHRQHILAKISFSIIIN
jgi:hypothetical protein